MNSTKDVIDHHLKSFGEGNLNGILSTTLPWRFCSRRRTIRGSRRSQAAIPGSFAEFAKPGSSFKLKHQSTKGDYGYILWSAETADNVYDLVTDTFVVQDGKIVAQSFAAKILPKG